MRVMKEPWWKDPRDVGFIALITLIMTLLLLLLVPVISLMNEDLEKRATCRDACESQDMGYRRPSLNLCICKPLLKGGEYIMDMGVVE
jgi:hypothetical protein